MKFLSLSVSLLLVTQVASARNLRSIWNDFDLKADLTLDETKDLGGFLTGADSGYLYSVKKVFIDTEPKFQRTDTYVLKLRAGYGFDEHSSASLKGEAQVTYVRNFDRKSKAVKAKPQAVRAFPKKATDITQNRKAIAVGDSVRIEFSSGSNLTAGLEKIIEEGLSDKSSILNEMGLKASFKTGTSFLIDVYRISESKVRLKMVAIRDSGTVGLKGSAKSALLSSVGVSLADSIIKRLVRCDFKLKFSKNRSRKKPTDTLMADYVINLKQKKGARLYDAFMDNLFGVQLTKHVNLFKSAKEFEDSIVSHTLPIDRASMKHRKEGARAPIQRIFKGRLLSDSSAFSVRASCLGLLKLSGMKFKNLSTLRSFDERDRPLDYLMYNVGVEKRGLLDDRTENFHHIWTAQRTDLNNPLSARPIELDTLTLNKVLEDDFSRGSRTVFKPHSEQDVLINEVVNLYPFLINKGNFANVFVQNRVDLVSSLKISLNKRILDSLKVQTGSEIRDWASETVSALESVGVYFSLGGVIDEEGRGRGPYLLDDYESALLPILNPTHLQSVVAERDFSLQQERDYVFVRYNRMLNSPLFRQIGFPYLMSLVDAKVLERNISFKYSLVLGEERNGRDFQIDKKGLDSGVAAQALEALRIINNRTFDLSIGE